MIEWKKLYVHQKGVSMVGIVLKDGESIEGALRRFKRDCTNAGILSEIKKRERYEKPSAVRKKALEAAKRKRDKKKRIFAKKDKI
jgi:small subunit ribosomal protein S21